MYIGVRMYSSGMLGSSVQVTTNSHIWEFRVVGLTGQTDYGRIQMGVYIVICQNGSRQ